MSLEHIRVTFDLAYALKTSEEGVAMLKGWAVKEPLQQIKIPVSTVNFAVLELTALNKNQLFNLFFLFGEIIQVRSIMGPFVGYTNERGFRK